jgi:hypothetical protein
MTEKTCLNATVKALLIKTLRMKGAARRATDLALSPMTGKILKRFGIRNPGSAATVRGSGSKRPVYEFHQIWHMRAARA